MKFDITSTYSYSDTFSTKIDIKKHHSIIEAWRDLDESELYIALGEMLDIRIIDGVAEEPNLENIKENLRRFINEDDEHFYVSEFNHQMSSYHIFGQIKNAVKDMISGLYNDSAYVIRSSEMNTTFEITRH